jgi:hypothetical protein
VLTIPLVVQQPGNRLDSTLGVETLQLKPASQTIDSSGEA